MKVIINSNKGTAKLKIKRMGVKLSQTTEILDGDTEYDIGERLLRMQISPVLSRTDHKKVHEACWKLQGVSQDNLGLKYLLKKVFLIN